MSKSGNNVAPASYSTEFPKANSLAVRLRRFRDDEDGVLIGFGVFLILMIVTVGGIGIDLMRFEYTRTSLQSTLDRAVLAAADLDQSLDAQFVVEDYFAKSEMSQYLTSVTVDEGLNYKEVAATAAIEMDTQFIHMLGIDALDALAGGTAAESVDGVEIALVLDMSGSMGSNSRMPNLKVAAKEFVTTMINSSPPGDVNVSIVPYATQVNAGETLAQHFNLTNEHTYSHCVDFEASDFNSTVISTTDSLQRTGPFDPIKTVEPELSWPVCPERTSGQIMPYSMNEIALHNYIEGFTAKGYTSTEIGTKWGAALLDPSLKPVVTQMITDGDVDAMLSGLPAEYNDDSLKVLVVMSDGENTNQWFLRPGYRDGLSPVWYYEGDYDNDGNVERIYSVQHNGDHYHYRRGGDACQGCDPTIPATGDEPFENEDGTADGHFSQQLTFPVLFHQASLKWLSDKLYKDIWSDSYADSYWRYNAYDQIGSSTKNARMDDICDAAKDSGIIIFTIGFEAPWTGQVALENCASSDAHYFDVDGIEISDAFTSIASSISKLRLVQ